MLGGYPGQPQRSAQAGQIQAFDPSMPLRRDPFSMFDDMMLSPFGGRGSPFGGGPFGGGLFGDLFGRTDQMMQEMERMSMGSGQMMASRRSGGNGVLMSGMGCGGGGGYSSQTFCFSSRTGADGQVHTERFSSSTIGDHSHRMREVQQAYSNSSTGTEKMSLERQLGDRGRKSVKERNHGSGEERQTDMFRGMSEDQAAEFDQHWHQQVAPRLPQHQQVFRHMVADERAGHLPARRPTQAALPAPNPPSNSEYYGQANRRGTAPSTGPYGQGRSW